MQIINLLATPHQSFSTRLDNLRFTLRIKEGNGIMLADIDCEGKTLISGHRIVAKEPLIPYQRLENFGNFIFLTENDDLPNWQAFGQSQKLIYLSIDEIKALRS